MGFLLFLLEVKGLQWNGGCEARDCLTRELQSVSWIKVGQVFRNCRFERPVKMVFLYGTACQWFEVFFCGKLKAQRLEILNLSSAGRISRTFSRDSLPASS